MGEMLRDKVAVITGSGRGIGRAIAILMAEEGAKVVINDFGVFHDGSQPSSGPADEVVKEIRSSGGTAVANYDSVATMDGGRKIIQTAIDTFGKIDILVNNAGLFWMKTFVDISEEEWDTMIEVHLKGHFSCTRAAVPFMIQQKSGRIINMASGAALGPWGAGALHYATAKAGILGFTRSLAREVGKYGITVNSVLPQARTRMVKMAASEMPLDIAPQTPEDIAPLVTYIASDAAQNINGATLAARVKGTIQLMCDPQPITGIYKEGRWTVSDLAAIMPKTLEPMWQNPAPRQV
jgi:NAD(P)-dependent dehydrogenase (short-subunit alcohol dehydrogenase family)